MPLVKSVDEFDCFLGDLRYSAHLTKLADKSPEGLGPNQGTKIEEEGIKSRMVWRVATVKVHQVIHEVKDI